MVATTCARVIYSLYLAEYWVPPDAPRLLRTGLLPVVRITSLSETAMPAEGH